MPKPSRPTRQIRLVGGRFDGRSIEVTRPPRTGLLAVLGEDLCMVALYRPSLTEDEYHFHEQLPIAARLAPRPAGDAPASAEPVQEQLA